MDNDAGRVNDAPEKQAEIPSFMHLYNPSCIKHFNTSPFEIITHDLDAMSIGKYTHLVRPEIPDVYSIAKINSDKQKV